MKKILLTMLFAACLVSCDFLLDLDTDLDPDQFYTVDFTNNSFYKVRAKILAEGEHCVIWVENGSGVTKDKAKEIAAKYDTGIRQKIVDAFGMKNINFNENSTQYHFDDILDYANWLAGKENKKLTILLLNIKDGFKDPTKDPYVAGYFYSGNFYPRNKNNSNGCDMIFVDTYPGLELMPEQTYATFAHELQHLINFATTVHLKRDRAMDTWIDEGLSSQAEHIYYAGTDFDGKGKIFDGNIIEHCKWFSEDKKGTIAKGNNFFVWGNNSDAILDEYSTVYLFFRWLYLQANSGLRSSIFRNIEESTSSDHTVITNVAKNINPAWADWDKLLSSWLAANYYPANSNYGYKDPYFYTGKNIIKVEPLKTTSTSLYPGEGVYSIINKTITPSAGVNIRYAGLPSSTSSIVTQGSFNSGVLLTYNANTNNKAKAETGSLTGVSTSVSSSDVSAAGVNAAGSRMAIDTDQTHTGPYIIDARDYGSAGILGRNK